MKIKSPVQRIATSLSQAYTAADKYRPANASVRRPSAPFRQIYKTILSGMKANWQVYPINMVTRIGRVASLP